MNERGRSYMDSVLFVMLLTHLFERWYGGLVKSRSSRVRLTGFIFQLSCHLYEFGLVS